MDESRRVEMPTTPLQAHTTSHPAPCTEPTSTRWPRHRHTSHPHTSLTWTGDTHRPLRFPIHSIILSLSLSYNICAQ